MPRLVVLVPNNLKESLRSAAEAQNTTMTEVANAALEDYLFPNERDTASLRLMSDISRKLDVALKRDEAILETIGRFILVYLVNTPALPPHEAEAAAVAGKARYNNFIEKLGASLRNNKTFLKAVEDATPSVASLYYSHVEGSDES